MSKQPIQTMPEGWIFQALWKHHAEARAKGKNFVVVVVNKTNIHSTLKINPIDKFNFYLFFFFAIVSYSHYKSLFISFFLIKKKKTNNIRLRFLFCVLLNCLSPLSTSRFIYSLRSRHCSNQRRSTLPMAIHFQTR